MQRIGRRIFKQVGQKLSRPIAYSSSSLRLLRNSLPLITNQFNIERKNYHTFSIVRSSRPEEVLEFQAETRKLLDIVTNSIYTDKEVFLRELISNASDALEKLRYNQSTGVGIQADSAPLEINIITDTTNNTITLIDNGIGMTRTELVSNLGTIARSGSKQFVQEVKEKSGSSDRDAEGIIGQFGVGFYSSFMVSDTVSVESISAAESELITAHKWSSDGSGVFKIEEIQPSDGMTHGSKIIMQLKDSCKEFTETERVKSIIQRYSNFVAFPIKLNGELVNTVSAIWTQDKAFVTEEQYTEFYKFISNAYDKPRYKLHFRTDAPLDLKCLFFIPFFHPEKFGLGRMPLGVNLYSRKVLIESKPKDLLPEWLRFVKGVVDSEDLPLSLSREKPQDSKLLARIKDVLTRKIIRFLDEKARNEPESYREFFIEYSRFLKEGVCSDHQFMEPISKLLLFESSIKKEGELISLDDYISRCGPEQKKIYFLMAPNRESAFASPYYETFKKHDREVLFTYSTADDFVFSNLKKYEGRSIVSAETSTIDLAKESPVDLDAEKSKEESESTDSTSKLSEEESKEFCTWLAKSLGNRVRKVIVSTRLSDSPAIITDHESAALRKMLKMVDQAETGKGAAYVDVPPQTLEINPNHPIVVGLFSIREKSSSTANMIAEQLLDNCLIAAGLVDDPRYMLQRINKLMLNNVNSASKGESE
eukprot:gene5772-7969_t